MQNVLITGGTGSLGTALTKAFFETKEGISLTILSRDPHKQALAKTRWPRLNCVLGDIRNKQLLEDLCLEHDTVIHAAALKIVGDADRNAKEYYSINVQGALNVAESARLTGVDNFLFISSDKACMPVTTYGHTKALAERLVLAQNTPYRHTKFSVLRYGNVVSSNGSVYNIWKSNIEQGLPITVKRPEPTRFILTMPQAVAMVMKSLEIMNGGEVFIPGKVPAFSVWDLANEIQPNKAKWIMEDLLPSEKIHEYMLASTEYIELATNDFLGINLWKIDNTKVPTSYEIPPMFYSAEAKRISGKDVINLLNAN